MNYREPIVYPDITRDKHEHWHNRMSIALGLKTKQGITVLGDGLSFVTERRDGGKITDRDTQAIKVHRLTAHAVIGFSGTNLETWNLKRYAKEVKDRLASKRPLTLLEIANETAAYLTDKLANDAILMALIAGYEYDKVGKANNPGFIRLENEGGGFRTIIDKECFSATADFKPWLDYRVSQGDKVGLNEPADSMKDAVDILDNIIHIVVDNLKTGIFVGGEIRAWHISPGGINEQIIDDIPSKLNMGDELPILSGERHPPLPTR